MHGIYFSNLIQTGFKLWGAIHHAILVVGRVHRPMMGHSHMTEKYYSEDEKPFFTPCGEQLYTGYVQHDRKYVVVL